MATKRPAPDSSETTHSRPPAWKRRKPNDHSHRPNHGKNSFKKAHPVNELKNSIRSLRRLLENQENLPADVRVEKERALQTAQRELVDAEKAKKRSDIIGKWHKIRFFERQKAERRLKKAKREVRECEDEEERAVLKGKVEDAEVDLNYALYFPLGVDYVKLWPGKGKKGGEDESPEAEGVEVERQGDKEMWELVRKCMKEGRLKDLREGMLNANGEEDEGEMEVEPPAKKKKKAAKVEQSVKSKSKGKSVAASREQTEATEDESGDESGGGFFE